MAAEGADLVHYPCPACGSPLYGWSAAHDPLDRGRRVIVDRCETCRLSVTRAVEPPDVGAELSELLEESGTSVALLVPNGNGLACSLGGAQWAGLEPELRRLHLSPDSARRLLAQRGIEVTGVATPYSRAGYSLMRQTLINAFTLRDNVLRNARAGRIPTPQTTRDRWLQRLDYLVSWLVWVPCAIAAWPIERIGSLLGRGGMLRVEGEAGAAGSGNGRAVAFERDSL